MHRGHIVLCSWHEQDNQSQVLLAEKQNLLHAGQCQLCLARYMHKPEDNLYQSVYDWWTLSVVRKTCTNLKVGDGGVSLLLVLDSSLRIFIC